MASPWVPWEHERRPHHSVRLGSIRTPDRHLSSFGGARTLSDRAPLLQAGSCLEMRLVGVSVEPGGVDVHSVAYFSSGDPDDH